MVGRRGWNRKDVWRRCSQWYSSRQLVAVEEVFEGVRGGGCRGRGCDRGDWSPWMESQKVVAKMFAMVWVAVVFAVEELRSRWLFTAGGSRKVVGDDGRHGMGRGGVCRG